MQRWQLATLTLALLVSGPMVQAQQSEADAPRGTQAILIRNPDTTPGTPPFALADQFGKVRRLVEPTPSIDLVPHVGQRIRINHDTGSTLLASQLDLPLPSAAREPRQLREVSPAQFVSPSRSAIGKDTRAPEPRDRRFAVIPTQATDEAAETFGDFMDDLPGPATERGSSVPATDPIRLDDLPQPDDSRNERLEPIPERADSYYEELPAATTIHAEPHQHSHGADCPHCNKHNPPPVVERQHEQHEPHGGDCPHCRPKVAPTVGLCNSCGRSPGWCGPTCNPPSRRGLYGRAEYLLWHFDAMRTPPLVTTSNDPQNVPLVGLDSTSVVFGGDLLDGVRNGTRFTIGGWLDDCRDFGIEFDWSTFETETDVFSYNDPAALGNLGRPFYNIGPIDEGTDTLLPPGEDVQLVSRPGQVAGALAITARSRFKNAGLRLRTGICCRDVGGCGSCGCGECVSGLGGQSGSGAISRIDFIAGYRWADLEEQLTFQENLTQVASGANVALAESFEVDNDFHGVDVGFIYDWQSRRWGLELMSRIALGGTTQRVAISGYNTISAGQGTAGVTTAGGLLTQSSNIGVYERDRFSVLPELSARLSYRITPRISLSAAYTLLYWANVVRPGDQIDYSVDGRLVAGESAPTANSHPRFDFEETSLWASGFNFGLDYQY